MAQAVSNAVLSMVIVLCAFVRSAETTPVFNATDSRDTTSNVSDLDVSHTKNATHSVTANTTSNPGCLKKRTTAKTSLEKDYDEAGAKNFIIVTVIVYALVGTLTLLLLRVCRRARRVHKYKDRMEEQVNNYLRVSSELKDAGNRYRMLCEIQRTTLTLAAMSIPRRQQRHQDKHFMELERERRNLSFDEVDSDSVSSPDGITKAEMAFSESSHLDAELMHQRMGRAEQRALEPVDEHMDETT